MVKKPVKKPVMKDTMTTGAGGGMGRLAKAAIKVKPSMKGAR